MNPVITIATCIILIVSWSNPYPTPYAGEIQGVVVIDGEVKFLTLRLNTEEIAIWTLAMKPEYRVIEKGYVAVMAIPSGVDILDLPLAVACNRIYLPLINRK